MVVVCEFCRVIPGVGTGVDMNEGIVGICIGVGVLRANKLVVPDVLFCF